MAFTTGTKIDFRFLAPQAFANAKAGSRLEPGSLYFVGNVIHLATGTNTAIVYGGVQTDNAPDDATDADEGVFYYDTSTGVLKIAINGAWVYLTKAISSIEEGSGNDEGKFVAQHLDGTKTTLSMPFIQALNEGNVNNTTHAPTIKAIVDWVKAQNVGFVGAVHWKGQLPDSLAEIVPPPESGWLYKTDENMTFETQTVNKGDWVIFKSATEFEVFAGVENAAVDVPIAGDHISPLSAHGASVLQTEIQNLDDNKIDKIEDAVGGRFPLTNTNGSIEESTLTLTNTLDVIGGAVNTKLPTEKAVADQIDRIDTELTDKLGNLGSGDPDRIITSNGDGTIKRGLTVDNELNSTNPREGVVLNEVAIKEALDDLKTSTRLEWIVD